MILSYQGNLGKKTRSLRNLGGEEEAAIYDLIFNEVSLRKIALKTGLSYQGVYIRALAYMKLWSRLGKIAVDKNFLEQLNSSYHNANEGEEAMHT